MFTAENFVNLTQNMQKTFRADHAHEKQLQACVFFILKQEECEGCF